MGLSLRTRVSSRTLDRIRTLVPGQLRVARWQQRVLDGSGIHADRVEQLYEELIRTVDVERLAALRRKLRHSTFDVVEACDYEVKLRIAIVKALLAGLHEQRPQQILDIGSGGGYFVAVCRHLGHLAVGSEVPAATFSRDVQHTYDVLGEVLRCPCDLRLVIKAFEPMQLPARFDLINAHKICFNGFRRPNEWSVPEWRHFVNDARRHLTENGRIQLELNENVDRYGPRRWYSAEQLAFFTSVGSVRDNAITIAGGTCLV
jgi:hypothetical protein